MSHLSSCLFAEECHVDILQKRAVQLAASSVLTSSAIILSDIFIRLLLPPAPLCLGPDQTLCDISRRFPRHTESLLGVMDLGKQAGSDISNPDFHCWSWLPD